MGKKQKFVLSSDGPEGLAAKFGRLITSPAWQDRRDDVIALYGAVLSADPATSARESAESRLGLALTGWQDASFLPAQRAELAFAAQLALLAAQNAAPAHKDMETANLVAYGKMFARVASQSPDYAIQMASENLKTLGEASPVATKIVAHSIADAALHFLRGDRKTNIPEAATLPEQGISVLAQLVGLSGCLDHTGHAKSRDYLATQLEATSRREYSVAPFAIASAVLMASAVTDDQVQKTRLTSLFSEVIAGIASPLQSNGLTPKDGSVLAADRLALTKLAKLGAQIQIARSLPEGVKTALSSAGAPLPEPQVDEASIPIAHQPRLVVVPKPTRQFTAITRPAERPDFWLKPSPALRYQKSAVPSSAPERYIAAMWPKPQG